MSLFHCSSQGALVLVMPLRMLGEETGKVKRGATCESVAEKNQLLSQLFMPTTLILFA